MVILEAAKLGAWPPERSPACAKERSVRNGLPLVPMRSDAVPVTLEIVNQLRDELP